jgi:hypothetical protein
MSIQPVGIWQIAPEIYDPMRNSGSVGTSALGNVTIVGHGFQKDDGKANGLYLVTNYGPAPVGFEVVGEASRYGILFPGQSSFFRVEHKLDVMTLAKLHDVKEDAISLETLAMWSHVNIAHGTCQRVSD